MPSHLGLAGPKAPMRTRRPIRLGTSNIDVPQGVECARLGGAQPATRTPEERVIPPPDLPAWGCPSPPSLPSWRAQQSRDAISAPPRQCQVQGRKASAMPCPTGTLSAKQPSASSGADPAPARNLGPALDSPLGPCLRTQVGFAPLDSVGPIPGRPRPGRPAVSNQLLGGMR